MISMSLILVVGLLVVAIRPTATKIAELVGQIKQQKELSAKLNDKINQDQQAAQLLEQSRQRLSLLSDGLPSTPMWKEWEKDMESLATQSGVKIDTLTIGGVQIKGDYVPTALDKNNQVASGLPSEVTGIDINLTVTGQYSQFRQFIEMLEKTRRINIFSMVEIDKQKDGSLKLSINGKIGYISEFTKI